MARLHPSMALLLDLVDEAFDRAAWHGPTLRGALRGVTAKQAAWRPARGRHNIRELALHAAYWKYAVRRRLTGEARGSFSLAGSNWFDELLAHMSHFFCRAQTRIGVGRGVSEHSAL